MNKLLSIFNFSKTIKEANVPIIEIISKGKKVHFLIDSGSSESYVDQTYINDLELYDTNKTKERSISHAGGITEDTTPIYTLVFQDSEGTDFVEEVELYDFSETFKVFKEENNITLYGILGTTFLQRYNCVIDFNNNIIRNVRKIKVTRE